MSDEQSSRWVNPARRPHRGRRFSGRGVGRTVERGRQPPRVTGTASRMPA